MASDDHSAGESFPGERRPGALLAREDELLVLADAAGIARIGVDADGAIDQWSRGAEITFGWSEPEISGQPLSALSFAAFRTGAEGRIFHSETSARHKDGHALELNLWSVERLEAKDGFYLLLIDITEKKFLERALLEASEREQRRIGQELHDHLCQHLLGAAFGAKALAGSLDRENSPHAAALHDLARLINDSVMQAREVSRGLNPVELDSAGLMSALQELANRARHSVGCVFQCKSPILVGNLVVALNAYRIAQEAVAHALQNNTVKKITITLASEGSSISLNVSDDGKQKNELIANPLGSAARTLQYRAQAMQGLLTMVYEPGKGNRTVCTFPKNS